MQTKAKTKTAVALEPTQTNKDDTNKSKRLVRHSRDDRILTPKLVNAPARCTAPGCKEVAAIGWLCIKHWQAKVDEKAKKLAEEKEKAARANATTNSVVCMEETVAAA